MDFLIWHLLRNSTQRFPNKEALVHNEQRLTYAEVAQKVESLALGLRNHGIRRGDRIGIFLEPSVPQVLSIFGISQAEGVYVPINSLLHTDQVIHIARDCGMKALITTASRAQGLTDALAQIPDLKLLILIGED
ncbi:MAG TPA: AMP-binding protein, partial [Dongiaceae bacterium]|nr:AMP-binding protein [Dongiaceae bacterium]